MSYITNISSVGNTEKNHIFRSLLLLYSDFIEDACQNIIRICFSTEQFENNEATLLHE